MTREDGLVSILIMHFCVNPWCFERISLSLSCRRSSNEIKGQVILQVYWKHKNNHTCRNLKVHWIVTMLFNRAMTLLPIFSHCQIQMCSTVQFAVALCKLFALSLKPDSSHFNPESREAAVNNISSTSPLQWPDQRERLSDMLCTNSNRAAARSSDCCCSLLSATIRMGQENLILCFPKILTHLKSVWLELGGSRS